MQNRNAASRDSTKTCRIPGEVAGGVGWSGRRIAAAEVCCVSRYTFPVFKAIRRGPISATGMEGWLQGRGLRQHHRAGLSDREKKRRNPPACCASRCRNHMRKLAGEQESLLGGMERKLKECEWSAGERPGVINFGVSVGTAQELISAEAWLGYEDGHRVVAVTTNNDIRTTARASRGRMSALFISVRTIDLMIRSRDPASAYGSDPVKARK